MLSVRVIGLVIAMVLVAGGIGAVYVHMHLKRGMGGECIEGSACVYFYKGEQFDAQEGNLLRRQYRLPAAVRSDGIHLFDSIEELDAFVAQELKERRNKNDLK